MSKEFLKSHGLTLDMFAKQTEERLKSEPENFWLSLAAKNQRDAAQEIQREISLAEAEEIGELIDLRFIGPKADGSIPLDIFFKIAEPLSHAWKLAAFRLRNGQEAGRLDNSISDTLNLRLAGMAYGSTRILVTGNAQPDLTGISLLQATLDQTFRLLLSKNDDFFDAVDAVGGRAAQKIGESIKAIDNAGLSAVFSWTSPKKRLVWEGYSGEVNRIRSLIETIQEPEEYTEELSGVVSGISDSGRLEIRTSEGKIQIRFPLKMTDKIRHLTITKPTTLSVKTSRYWNAVAKRDVFKRQFIQVIE